MIGVPMMLNYIGDTRRTLRESIDFFKEIGVKPTFVYATPYPGTELYRMALEKGRIKDEEEYLKSLDNTNIFTGAPMNLTDMSDEEAAQAIKEATEEINRYYFRRALFMPINYRTFFTRIRKTGLKEAGLDAFRRIKRGILREFKKQKTA